MARRRSQALPRSARATVDRTPRTVSLSVLLPRDIETPRRVIWRAPAPLNAWNRHRRLALRAPKRIMVKRRVTVVTPKYLVSAPPTIVSMRKRNITVYSRRRTAAILATERNRKRYNEGKRRKDRNRLSDGQLASIRSDPFGIVAAAMARGTPQAVQNAAMISRALTMTKGYF